jgi:hypothetical protein
MTYSTAQLTTQLDKQVLQFEICVVGGGLAGVCAAIAAARNGAKTALIQDRAVLGGNASSEIRMWISGAKGSDQKEAGIIEEILLENLYRNPGLKYTIWDQILYSKTHYQENLTLFLNTSVIHTHSKNALIQFVEAWQLSSQRWIELRANQFIDCSGDAILRYCGAEFFRGRESAEVFDEPLAIPEQSDNHSMGNTILLQLREVDSHTAFIPPDWAYQYSEADLPNRILKAHAHSNFWWLEVGGMQDTIADAESIRDELLKIAYGVWALIKNHPDGRGHNWELEWIGSLPGKRESIRYKGAWVLTQKDIQSGGHFSDIVAYGGWPMDDHYPEGIHYKGRRPSIFHPTPSPYGIPLRCLYSSNIDNLLFAGRNISTSHMAMGSVRVMATCAIVGQAIGTAAALAQQLKLQVKQLTTEQIARLQQTLLDQDGYLPGVKRQHPRAIPIQILHPDAAKLSNGIDRALGGEDNGLWLEPGESVEIRLEHAQPISGVRLIHDSDFKNIKRMPCSYPLKRQHVKMPSMLAKDYRIDYYDPQENRWEQLLEAHNNIQRLRQMNCPPTLTARLRLTLLSSWGAGPAHIFALDVF